MTDTDEKRSIRLEELKKEDEKILTNSYIKPTEDTHISQVYDLIPEEDKIRGDKDLAEMKMKTDTWIPTKEERRLCEDWIQQDEYKGRMSYEMALQCFMYAKNRPEECLAMERGEFKLKDELHVKANADLEKNDFVWKTDDHPELLTEEQRELLQKTIKSF